MKNILIGTFILFCFRPSYGQINNLPEIEHYFSAIIVKDIDESVLWYTEILKYQLVDNKEYPKMGFKQANLKNATGTLELLEIDAAYDPAEIIPNYGHKSKTLGLFKLGFKVANFDQWIEHLTQSKVEFHGSVVKNVASGTRMFIIKDPDGNRIQFFEK